MESGRDRLERQVAGVAALDEPVRRTLYLHVVSHEETSRDEAAAAAGISRALAAFHLDKLVEEGLLEARFRRLTGRTGPGAGRPAKLYRRSPREITVSLPPRSYELAARLLLQSMTAQASLDSLSALRQTACDFGTQLGVRARDLAGPRAGRGALVRAACSVLETYGFEPETNPSGSIHLRNCPFHALAQEFRTTVCGMNLALMQGVVTGLEVQGVEAVLDPQPGMCCVTFTQEKSNQ